MKRQQQSSISLVSTQSSSSIHSSQQLDRTLDEEIQRKLNALPAHQTDRRLPDEPLKRRSCMVSRKGVDSSSSPGHHDQLKRLSLSSNNNKNDESLVSRRLTLRQALYQQNEELIEINNETIVDDNSSSSGRDSSTVIGNIAVAKAAEGEESLSLRKINGKNSLLF